MATRLAATDSASASILVAAAVLLGDFLGQVFVRGLLITLVVVASLELLEMGETGVGLLNAAIGLGGLVGALGALGLTGGRRLHRVFLVALALWGLPLVAIGAWPLAAVALIGLFVTGVSNALVAVLGERGALVVSGVILPVLALATWRPIVREVGHRPALDERLALLRLDPLFAPLPLTALDLLAERMTHVSSAAGDVLMRKGDRGEEYVLLANGRDPPPERSQHGSRRSGSIARRGRPSLARRGRATSCAGRERDTSGDP